MKTQINENELEQVVGGTVCISESRMLIKFTALGAKTYPLNCTFNQANILALTMYEDYKDKSAQEYENAVKDAMADKGWINP